MKTKEITLCGKTVTLAYCFATEIAFLQYTGKSLEEYEPGNAEHIIYLILSSILSYYNSLPEKPKAPVVDTDLMYHATPEELTNALSVALELRREWYQLPAGEPDDDNKEEDKKNV